MRRSEPPSFRQALYRKVRTKNSGWIPYPRQTRGDPGALVFDAFRSKSCCRYGRLRRSGLRFRPTRPKVGRSKPAAAPRHQQVSSRDVRGGQPGFSSGRHHSRRIFRREISQLLRISILELPYRVLSAESMPGGRSMDRRHMMASG